MHQLELFTYVWIAASVLWGAMVLWWVRKGLALSAPGEPPTKRQNVFRDNLMIIWVLMVIGGSGMMTTTFSDDVIRYAWDGWVTVNGGNPYSYAPAAPELEHLRVTDGGLTLPEEVPYNDLKTSYPPGAQLVFAAVAWAVGTDVGAWGFVWLVALIPFFTLIHQWKGTDLRSEVWLGLVLVSPLFWLQGLSEVHLDVLVGASMFAAFLAARRERYITAGILLGIGISLKFLPIVALGFLMVGATGRQRLQLLSTSILLVTAVYLPFLGGDFLGNLPNFASTWRANAGLYEMVRLMLPATPARWLMLGLGMLMVSYIWKRYRHQPPTATALTLVAMLLVSPVVHAWYLLPVVLLLPLAPLRSTLVWMVTISVYGLWVVAYRTTGVWTETPALLAVEYVPVWIAFAVDLKRGPYILNDLRTQAG